MRVLALACGLMAALPLGSVDAQRTSQDSDAIITLELNLCDLLERGAFEEYARHLTQDYVLTTTQGQVLSRDQALAWWRAQGPGYKMNPTQMQVRVYGNAAILTARVTGPSAGPGDRITKTFVRVGGAWLLASLHASQIADEPRK